MRAVPRAFLALAVAASLAAPARAEDTGHVVILRHDGGSYARWSAPGVPNDAPRKALSRQFYQSHSDDYDFLVVFPAFPNVLAGEAGGLHTGVRSDVAGIGRPYLDRGGEFGSAARLKAFIDVAALTPGAPASSLRDVLGVVVHEIGHQWLANVAYLDVVTGLERRDLLGQEGSHWSALLDTDASVLYGADWVDDGTGAFTAAASRRRFSDLDLYLMGLSPASDVAPLTLLHPTAPGAPDPTAVGVADGTTIAAVPERIDLSQIVAVEGPRVPAAGASQAVFRIAFALAVGPGQVPAPEQVAFVDQVRRAWGDTFFVLTRGRGLMQADLMGVPTGPPNQDATVARGVEWLLAHQADDGSWADSGATIHRDTAAAAEALALLGGDARVAAAVQRGSAFLRAGAPTDVDSAARRALALAAAGQPAGPGGPALDACAGCGLASGYAASVIDTALAAQATLVQTGSPSAASKAVAFLLARQGADGGWPFAPGGPSRIEPTTRVLQVLARAAPTPASAYAMSRGADFLQARRTASGLLADDGTASAEATAIGILGLAAAGAGPGSSWELLGQQQGDGSWEGSAHATAQVLQVLRVALAPNLSLDPQGVFLPRSLVVAGDVNAFTAGTEFDPTKVFYGVELPTLRKNPEWSRKITYRGY